MKEKTTQTKHDRRRSSMSQVEIRQHNENEDQRASQDIDKLKQIIQKLYNENKALNKKAQSYRQRAKYAEQQLEEYQNKF